MKTERGLNLLKRIVYFMKKNGISLTITEIVGRICRRIFNYALIWKREDLDVHPSARIIGISNITIGKRLHSGVYCWIEAIKNYSNIQYSPKIIIKDNVILNDFVHIASTNYIEIGNNVLIASKVYISDHNHGFYAGLNQTSPLIPPNDRILNNDKKVIIGDNVWIGESVSILPGVIIGDGCVIGAGSIVTKSIPAYSIAFGVPAKVTKKYDFSRKEWITVEKKEESHDK